MKGSFLYVKHGLEKIHCFDYSLASKWLILKGSYVWTKLKNKWNSSDSVMNIVAYISFFGLLVSIFLFAISLYKIRPFLEY